MNSSNIKGSERQRIELNLNQNVLVLELNLNENKDNLRDELAAKSPKQIDHRTNAAKKIFSPSPNNKRMKGYGLIHGYLSPQNLGNTEGFSTIRDTGTLYINE